MDNGKTVNLAEKEHKSIREGYKKGLRRFAFSKRNRTLLALTGILVFMILLIVKYCDFPLILPEKYFGLLICNPEGDKLWYNIGISYVAAYLFYIIQVYLPATTAERRAFKEVRRQLSKVLRFAKTVLYLFDNMFVLDEQDEPSVKNSSWCYEETYYDSYSANADYFHKREIVNGKTVRKAKKCCDDIKEFKNEVSKCKESYIYIC